MGFFPSTIYNIDGQFIKWERTVKNNGPNSTTDVYLEITAIDPVFGYISHSVSKGSYNSLTKKWTIGQMAHNEEAKITIYFVTQSAAFADVFLTAEVYGAGTDLDTVNNEVTDSMMYVNLNDDIRDFVVSDRTAYVSTVRNLNNEVGTPVYGDISRCWNINTSGFDWVYVYSMPDETLANIYMFGGDYGNQTLSTTTYNANYSKFNALTISNSASVFNVGTANSLNIGGRSNVEINNLGTSQIGLTSGGADISVKNIEGSCIILLNTASTYGVYNINIGEIIGTSVVQIKTGASFSKHATYPLSININVEKMDGKLFIGDNTDQTILSGVDLKVNVSDCVDGVLELKNITRDSNTSINISGSFFDDGKSGFAQAAKIQFTGTWNGTGLKPIIKDSTIICREFGSPSVYAKAISAGALTTAFSCLNTTIITKAGENPIDVNAGLQTTTNFINIYTNVASVFTAALFNDVNIQAL